MRKPYTYNQKTDGEPPVIGSDALLKRPGFPLKIAVVCNEWCGLEANMLMLFNVLLAGQEPIAFAIYYDILNWQSRTRDRIFDAVAEEYGLPEDTLTEVRKLRQDVEVLAKRRNEIAHALWAAKDAKPDTLLALRSPIEWLENFHAVIGWNVDAGRGDTATRPPLDVEVITEYWEFSLADFDELRTEIDRLTARAQKLHGKIASHLLPAALQPRSPKIGQMIRLLRKELESYQSASEILSEDYPE